MSFKEPICVHYPFVGGNSYGATVDANGWKGTIVKSAGNPSAANVAGGGVSLLTDSTSEAQSVSLTHADLLSFPLSYLLRVRFEMKASASIPSATNFFAGVGSALNTTYGSMTNAIGFVMSGSNSVSIYTDDGTLVNNGVATGQSIGTSFSYWVIDFSQGLSDIRFYMEDAYSLRRVAASTTFSIANASSNNVQPVFFNVKTSSTNALGLVLRNLSIERRSN
jgi:hypothetical protein